MRVVRYLCFLLIAFGVLALPAPSRAQIAVGISVHVGPPAIPVYEQPICPEEGFLWTPGYWSYGDAGYFWVPGTWVRPPRVGFLWTPGYWGWAGGGYGWHGGYWGPDIGFYGGINYGFGYGGVGFVGGEWRGGGFYYNRSVTNVSVTNVTNVYNKTVIVNENHTAFNGGEVGVRAEPTAQERVAEHEQHVAPLAMQTQHQTLAAQNRQNFASENHGRPAIAATAKAGDFSGRSAIPARAAGGEYHPPAMSPKEARGPSTPGNRPFTPANSNNENRTTGNSTVTPQEKGNANGGFRPFTPPNTTTSPNKGASTSPTYQQHGNAGGNSTYQPPKSNTAPPTSNPPRNTGGSNTSHPAQEHHSTPPPQHK